MITVSFAGGLGNQMFQYAFYMAQKHRKKDVKMDLSFYSTNHDHNGFELDKIFNILIDEDEEELKKKLKNEDNYFNRLKRKLGFKYRYYYQKSAIKFYEDAMIYDDGYMCGYWQSEKYFDMIKNEVKNIYNFPDIIDERNKSMESIIRRTNSVSVHVRRGDYIGLDDFNVIPELYYLDAVNYIKGKVTDPYFFVFSNDIEWCKRNIVVNNAMFIDYNKGKESFRDMQLMSLCKHHIIANSSFSWWGAWLGEKDNTITIAPNIWLKSCINGDIVPERWVRLG